LKLSVAHKKTSGVYAMTDSCGNILYIGSASTCLYRRMHQHRHRFKNKTHYLSLCQSHYENNTLQFIVLEQVPAEKCLEREQQLLDLHMPADNRSPSAYSNEGFKHSEDTKRRFRQRKVSEETKQKLSEYAKQQQWTKEQLEYRARRVRQALNKKIECSTGHTFNSVKDASKYFGIPTSSISRILIGYTDYSRTRHGINFWHVVGE
jgi:group I intron endonuclease